MERIEEAIRKAKTSGTPEMKGKPRSDAGRTPRYAGAALIMQEGPLLWDVPEVPLNAALMERHRVVTYARTDPSHVAFKILRTRLHQILSENVWSSVAVTSPTAGCGKTMVAVNLAFGLARQTDCRTVLIDLDLKKSSVSQTLGIKAKKSLGEYILGEAALEDCFVQVDSNLFVGLNHNPVASFSEMTSDQCVQNILPVVMEALKPKVVIIDLPPMLAGDEVMAYIPQVDCGFLVAAASKSTAREIEDCESQFSTAANFLGVVLNKCTEEPQDGYQYEGE